MVVVVVVVMVVMLVVVVVVVVILGETCICWKTLNEYISQYMSTKALGV